MKIVRYAAITALGVGMIMAVAVCYPVITVVELVHLAGEEALKELTQRRTPEEEA